MDKDYLDPGFDASKLTVLKLRQILTAHEIYPPSQAKKAELVKIFNEKIKANSEEIKNQLDVKPDETTIENKDGNRRMSLRSRSSSSRRSPAKPSGQNRDRSMTPSGYSDEEDEVKPKISSPLRNSRTSVLEPSSSLKTPIVKKSTSQSRSPTRSHTRERSLTPSGYSDDEDVKPKISSPLRNSRTAILDPSSNAKTPVVKNDNEEVNPQNPFQSYRDSTSTHTGRKSPTPIKSNGSKSKSSSIKSDTKTSKINGYNPTPTKSTNGEIKDDDETESDLDETKSTPAKTTSNQSQMNTIQRSAQSSINGGSASSIHTIGSRRSARLQNSSSKKSQGTPSHASSAASSNSKAKASLAPIDESAPKIPSPVRDPLPYQENLTYNQEIMYQFKHRQDWGIVKTLIYLALNGLLITFLIFYRYEKVKLGYSNSTKPVEETSPFDFLRPLPMPCPAHAICEDRQVKGCKPGFQYREHPLSNRIWPFFSPICIPNVSTTKVINVATDEIINYASDHCAKVICRKTGESQDISLDSIRSYLEERSQYRKELKETPSLFEDTIENIARNHNKVIAFYNKANNVVDFRKIDKFELDYIESLISTNPNYSLTCKISNFLRELAYKYRFNISKLLAGFVFGVWVYFWNQNRIRVNAKVNGLTNQVIKILMLASQSQTPPRPGSIKPVALPIYQIRDILLAKEFPSIQIRQQLWKRVIRQVERNSNVRSRTIVCKGESQEVWEWVGAATGSSTISTPGHSYHFTPTKAAVSTSQSQEVATESVSEPQVANITDVQEENLYPSLNGLL